MENKIEMNGVTEYGERMGIFLGETKGRLVVLAFNQAGYDATAVDLVELLEWVKINRPELLD